MLTNNDLFKNRLLKEPILKIPALTKVFIFILVFSVFSLADIFSEAQLITEQSYAINPNTVLDIINRNGSVSIMSHERNDVVITTKKISWAWQGTNEIEKVKLEVREDTVKNKTIVETKYTIDEEKVFVYLEIKIPVSLKINTIICNNGLIDLRDVSGAISIVSNNGSVNGVNIAGSLMVTTNSGDIFLDGIIGDVSLTVSTGKISIINIQGNLVSDLKSGKITIQNLIGFVNSTINRGDITLINSSGDAYIYVMSGSIQISGLIGNAKTSISEGLTRVRGISGLLDAQSENGSIKLSAVGGVMKCKTVNGSITADINSMPQSGTVLTTDNGDISVSFNNSIDASLEIYNPRGNINTGRCIVVTEKHYDKLLGLMGNGGPSLIISTQNGSISVRN